MTVNFQQFVDLLKKAEESGKVTRAEAMVIRNQVATLTRPKCPEKLAMALATQVNMKLGVKVVS